MKVGNVVRTLLVLSIILLLVYTTVAANRVSTFKVHETDFVKVTAETFDLDRDKVRLYYTLPLDHKGEWQTTLDDAGEYDVTIIADDGKARTRHFVHIIVENTNQPPQQVEKVISVKETETIDLRTLVTDPDEDALSYSFKKPFSTAGLWTPDYGDRGALVTVFNVSDGEFEIKVRASINVLEKNKPPIITNTFSENTRIITKEDSTLYFSVNVQDDDDDEILYDWRLDNNEVSKEASGSFYFDFESEGEHTLMLTVSDGEEELEKKWEVIVENKNREPTVTLLPINVREGEKVVLNLPPTDIDGDSLTYSFEDPLDAAGTWQTDSEDAGVYNVQFTFTDGEFKNSDRIEIIVIDVDRAPTLEVPAVIEVNEGEKVLLQIKSTDPDGDEIEFSFEGLPTGAKFNRVTQTVTWTPDFETVTRSGNLLSNILNWLRLERFFLPESKFPIKVTSCGKEVCTSETTKFLVANVNRGPTINPLFPTTLTETELAVLEPTATDPDGDIIRFYFTEPVGKRNGKWQTHYESAGVHEVTVEATDGQVSDTTQTTITVIDVNREPLLDVSHNTIKINEGKEFTVRVSAEDPDGDNVDIRLDNLPPGASFSEGRFVWSPGFDTVRSESDTTIWLSFVATDNEFEVIQPVGITVKNVNQVPVFVSLFPEDQRITVDVNQPVLFSAPAGDPDGEDITYTWDFGFGQDDVTNTTTVERIYTSPGKKKVTVTATDGMKSVSYDWHVTVEGEIVVEQPVVVVPEPTATPAPIPTFGYYVINH